jgi:hypothetical protein
VTLSAFKKQRGIILTLHILKKNCPTDFDCVSFTPSFGASGGTIIIWKGNKLHGEVILENEFAQAVQFMSKLNGENGF